MLPASVRTSVESALQGAFGTATQVTACRPVSGGCINDVWRVDTSAGDRYLLKTISSANASGTGVFAAEAAGLAALRSEVGPCVPEVIAVGSSESTANEFLLIEWIESGAKPRDFFERFGRSLAELHRAKTSSQFGFDADNFIGSTLQTNGWQTDWRDFFCEQRLGFQIELACHNGHADSFPAQQIDRFKRAVHELLSATADEPPALIHGDLWSGNWLCNRQGRAVLIDPAVYYASRETEFGMTTLFGGFDNRFYDAYSEAYPLTEGWRQRAEIYRLYHVLNHLNLFGSSYLAGCREIISRFA